MLGLGEFALPAQIAIDIKENRAIAVLLKRLDRLNIFLKLVLKIIEKYFNTMIPLVNTRERDT
jgi:hypothetical protein